MLQSAEKGDKSSLYFVAKAYDTGLNLSKNKQIDWLKSIEYYQRVLNKTNDDDDDEMTEQIDDCEPTYIILARMAEMNMIGEHNLEQDLPEAASLFTEAAEKAMLYGKGRLANKYYQRSEEASSMADNEDD
jgi:elongation factor 2 kinase